MAGRECLGLLLRKPVGVRWISMHCDPSGARQRNGEVELDHWLRLHFHQLDPGLSRPRIPTEALAISLGSKDRLESHNLVFLPLAAFFEQVLGIHLGRERASDAERSRGPM